MSEKEIKIIDEFQKANKNLEIYPYKDENRHVERMHIKGEIKTDLAKLSELEHLKIIILQDKNLRDLKLLEPLKHSETLKHVVINSAQIEDFSMLTELKNVTDLTLRNVPLSNYMIETPPFYRERFEHLFYFRESKIWKSYTETRIAKVKNTRHYTARLLVLTNLEKLQLINNGISDLSDIVNLTNLKDLYIGDNYIFELHGLEKLEKLHSLSLTSTPVTEIAGLESLSRLKNLTITDNIWKISGLDTLKNLETLHLGNDIFEIQGLENLTNLKKLNLFLNRIEQIKGLETLRNLTTLDLRSNKISEIKGIENLQYLEVLDIDHNEVTKIEDKSLETLARCKHLILDDNPLSVSMIKKLRIINKYEYPYYV